MSYHQPLPVPGAFPRVRTGLRPATLPEPAAAPDAPAPFAPAEAEAEEARARDGADDAPDHLRAQMLREIEQALETDDAGIAAFHVGLATLYARRLAAGASSRPQAD